VKINEEQEKKKLDRISRDAFANCHPIVNLLYFICVIGFAMASLHPVCLIIALFGAFVYSMCLGGVRMIGSNLKYMIPVIFLTALINPAFSHQGVTILWYFPSGNPLTLESILYGAAAAVMLAAVLCWFASFNRVMTSDKMIYLFGRLAPYLSLVISMTLKFFPEFNTRIKQVYQAQKAAGFVIKGNHFKKIRAGMRAISSAATWALERAVITGDSMKSRGYGLGKRTAFSLFRFRSRDIVCLIWILVTGGYALAGWLEGAVSFQYYPGIAGAAQDGYAISVFLSYALLVLLPSGMHLYETATA
jgi:hypothetical protein